MKTLERFIIVRDINGNDLPFKYEVKRFDSVHDAIQYYGEDALLELIHRLTDQREREMIKADTFHQMRQRMKNK